MPVDEDVGRAAELMHAVAHVAQHAVVVGRAVAAHHMQGIRVEAPRVHLLENALEGEDQPLLEDDVLRKARHRVLLAEELA